jgi:hypothetical protein
MVYFTFAFDGIVPIGDTSPPSLVLILITAYSIEWLDILFGVIPTLDTAFFVPPNPPPLAVA